MVKELPRKGDTIKCPYCDTEFKFNGNPTVLQECPKCHSKLLM